MAQHHCILMCRKSFTGSLLHLLRHWAVKCTPLEGVIFSVCSIVWIGMFVASHCNATFSYCCNNSSVCLSSLMWVYYEAGNVHFSLKIAQCVNFCKISFTPQFSRRDWTVLGLFKQCAFWHIICCVCPGKNMPKITKPKRINFVPRIFSVEPTENHLLKFWDQSRNMT